MKIGGAAPPMSDDEKRGFLDDGVIDLFSTVDFLVGIQGSKDHAHDH